jgi:phosphoribosylformylglycinamidine synthase
VRAGRLIEIEHDAEVSHDQLRDMCQKLLANTVIENFEIEGT